eukprot:c34620_g1_i1.p1 GENE.c34620_g1_i1~~c34620_g1_i1.p1  ORF type:complete len:134 (+),score=16.81 c34620_g1_i1:129-530(+)
MASQPPSPTDLRSPRRRAASEGKPQKGFWEVVRERPLVPALCMTTAAILCVGVWSMTQRNPKLSNYLMRARVAAQAVTLIVAVYGINEMAKEAKEALVKADAEEVAAAEAKRLARVAAAADAAAAAASSKPAA